MKLCYYIFRGCFSTNYLKSVKDGLMLADKIFKSNLPKSTEENSVQISKEPYHR